MEQPGMPLDAPPPLPSRVAFNLRARTAAIRADDDGEHTAGYSPTDLVAIVMRDSAASGP